jgi:hypothetical protein
MTIVVCAASIELAKLPVIREGSHVQNKAEVEA